MMSLDNSFYYKRTTWLTIQIVCAFVIINGCYFVYFSYDFVLDIYSMLCKIRFRCIKHHLKFKQIYVTNTFMNIFSIQILFFLLIFSSIVSLQLRYNFLLMNLYFHTYSIIFYDGNNSYWLQNLVRNLLTVSHANR